MKSRIIFLNGTSSSGKSTIAGALRAVLDPSFCYYASDQLADSGFRPVQTQARDDNRGKFFDGFHRSIAAFAEAGNDLVVEHIIEGPGWADDLHRLLSPFDVFWIGVYAPLQEVERRELLRKDRKIGEARYHFNTHRFCRYNLEVDSTAALDTVVLQIVKGWEMRKT